MVQMCPDKAESTVYVYEKLLFYRKTLFLIGQLICVYVCYLFVLINALYLTGVVYLMGKAYLTWTEDKYLQSCLKCGEVVWNKGLLKKGPGMYYLHFITRCALNF